MRPYVAELRETIRKLARKMNLGRPQLAASLCLPRACEAFKIGGHLRGDVKRCDQGTQVVGQLAIVFARTQIKLAITSIQSFGDQFAFSCEALKAFQFGLKTDHVMPPKTCY